MYSWLFCSYFVHVDHPCPPRRALNRPQILDFVIWLLFRRRPPPFKPQHLLCHGFERASAAGQHGLDLSAAPGIPGIVCHFPNPHVETVTSPAWCKLLSLLGKGGDMIMVDLLLECALFVPALDGIHSLRQVSGNRNHHYIDRYFVS